MLILAIATVALAIPAQGRDSEIEQALTKYDKAFRSKDVETIRKLLADDIVLYEHSVKNIGLKDAFENHLKPEILEFEDMVSEFSDVRITPSAGMALVTRQYKIQGKMKGKEITASGNETMVWKKVGKEWKVAHIHYSHPCPRPSR
jgi:ketosteroid isomerase-like protein